MNFFTKTRILIGIIIILSAIIVAMFGTMSYHRLKVNRREIRENREPRENPQPMKYMAKQLQLSPEQIREFENLRDKFHSESDVIMKESRDVSKLIMDEITSDKPNYAKLDSLSKRFGELQTSQKQLMYKHLLEIRSKCTDSQQANFKKLLHKLEDHERMYRERRRNNNVR